MAVHDLRDRLVPARGSGGNDTSVSVMPEYATDVDLGVGVSLLRRYVTTQRAAGRSPGTIRTYGYYLDLLLQAHADPLTVTRYDLELLLSRDSWKPETRKSCRAALRSFYRWAHEHDLIGQDPASKLPTITVPRAVARPAPEHLVRQLVVDQGRVGLMAMLAAFCGLRRAEISRVHSDDLVDGELLVRGKGGKVRSIPVTSPTLAAAIEDADGWLFPSQLGGHLSPGHVGRLLSNALPKGWSAHTLRHRMASVAYAQHGDLLALGEVLGHARPETTQRYVRVPSAARVRQVAAATSL